MKNEINTKLIIEILAVFNIKTRIRNFFTFNIEDRHENGHEIHDVIYFLMHSFTEIQNLKSFSNHIFEVSNLLSVFDRLDTITFSEKRDILFTLHVLRNSRTQSLQMILHTNSCYHTILGTNTYELQKKYRLHANIDFMQKNNRKITRQCGMSK